MSRIRNAWRALIPLLIAILVGGCADMAAPRSILVCTKDGVESFRGASSRTWYAVDGVWRSFEGDSYRQSMFESCGTQRVAE